MKIVRLKKKELEKKYGGEVYAFVSKDNDDEIVVYLPRCKISAGKYLHELYHATHRDLNEQFKSLYEWALEELRAEEFTRKSRNKELNTNNVDIVAYTMMTEGNKPSSVMGAIIKALNIMGHELTDEMKSELWWNIRHYYKLTKDGLIGREKK
jgi:hypothetical protein